MIVGVAVILIQLCLTDSELQKVEKGRFLRSGRFRGIVQIVAAGPEFEGKGAFSCFGGRLCVVCRFSVWIAP